MGGRRRELAYHPYVHEYPDGTFAAEMSVTFAFGNGLKVFARRFNTPPTFLSLLPLCPGWGFCDEARVVDVGVLHLLSGSVLPSPPQSSETQPGRGRV